MALRVPEHRPSLRRAVVRSKALRPPVAILGVRVSTLSLTETVDTVVSWGRGNRPATGPRTVFATTVHGLIEAWRDDSFRAVLDMADIVTADGMPLVWLGRARTGRNLERVCGPDLMLAVCEATSAAPVRHFFYGGAPGVAERLAALLGRRFAGLRVAGWYSPPFRALTDDERRGVVSLINESGADVIWVGLGNPKQERWATETRSALQAKVVLTVGAAFDFHAGIVARAPAFLQRAGLEWAFRLWQEPRRLWRRYLVYNPLFVALVLAESIGVWRPPVGDPKSGSE